MTIKPEQLKTLLKPLIKEAVMEMLVTDGLLSKIVSEVASGLSNKEVITEQAIQKKPSFTKSFNKSKLRQEMMADFVPMEENPELKKIFNKTGLPSHIFENVEPLAQGGTAKSSTSSAAPASSTGALRGIDPNDAGVDISAFMELAGGKINKIMNFRKKG